MKIEPIRIFEHESLKIGEKGFTEKHLKLLSKYLGDKEGDDFPYYSLINNGVSSNNMSALSALGISKLRSSPRRIKS